MTFYCYIIYSKTIDHYYVGSTSNFEERLSLHNRSHFGGKSYTGKTNDWEPYLVIQCSSIEKAIALEKFIKKRKSRKYIQNLKTYPDLLSRILNKLDENTCSPSR